MNIRKDIINLPNDFPFQITTAIIQPSHHMPSYYHWHECLEISYVQEGKGEYYVEGQTFSMEAGDIILFNNIEPHAWRAIPPHPMVQPVIVFHPSLIWSGSENLFDYQYLKPFVEKCTTFNNKLPSNSPVTRRIYKLLLYIQEEYNKKEIGYQLMIKTKLMEIMTLLIRHFQDEKKRSELLHKKKQKLQRLEKVMQYIKQNYASSITLEEVSKVACMSPNYFSTVFKQTLGVSFSEYLTRFRISKAISLIHGTDRTLVDIATSCGFNSMSNFYRAYQKYHGGNPSDIRK